MNTTITPVRLRLELRDEHLSLDEQRMLKRYGESRDGKSIIRDILIPSDMPLHNLHYAIQKLFGWQNSHLRRFTLPEAVFDKLTNREVSIHPATFTHGCTGSSAPIRPLEQRVLNCQKEHIHG